MPFCEYLRCSLQPIFFTRYKTLFHRGLANYQNDISWHQAGCLRFFSLQFYIMRLFAGTLDLLLPFLIIFNLFLPLLLYEKLNPHILHKVAVFLHPHQRRMSKLSAAEWAEVTDYLCDKVGNVPLATFEPPPKKPRTALDMFDDDDADDVTTTCELDRLTGIDSC